MSTTLEVNKGDYLEFDYINWKGEKSHRKVVVDKLKCGSNEWHKEKQFLLHAFDVEKLAMRNFAIKDMSNIVVYNIK